MLDGRIFSTASSASKYIGVSSSTISRALNSGRTYVKDAVGERHHVSFVDQRQRYCPCCGKEW